LIREYFWLIVTTEEWDMRQTNGTRRSAGEKIVKDIKRATRKHYSSEEKIRIVLDGLRGEERSWQATAGRGHGTCCHD